VDNGQFDGNAPPPEARPMGR